jgi:hypothetical protein
MIRNLLHCIWLRIQYDWRGTILHLTAWALAFLIGAGLGGILAFNLFRIISETDRSGALAGILIIPLFWLAGAPGVLLADIVDNFFEHLDQPTSGGHRNARLNFSPLDKLSPSTVSNISP